MRAFLMNKDGARACVRACSSVQECASCAHAVREPSVKPVVEAKNINNLKCPRFYPLWVVVDYVHTLTFTFTFTFIQQFLLVRRFRKNGSTMPEDAFA